MSDDISPQNEHFIREVVKSGRFRDRGQALDEAVQLLKKRLELLQHIDEGTRQLAAGDYAEYDEKGLREFFDDVQRQGRMRYEASKKSS
jgi:Arc/MetJ-type ribon-helix-helix transcriptional regulator